MSLKIVHTEMNHYTSFPLFRCICCERLKGDDLFVDRVTNTLSNASLDCRIRNISKMIEPLFDNEDLPLHLQLSSHENSFHLKRSVQTIDSFPVVPFSKWKSQRYRKSIKYYNAKVVSLCPQLEFFGKVYSHLQSYDVC